MEKKEPIDKRSKAERVLRMYDLLMRGKVINKADAGQKIKKLKRTIYVMYNNKISEGI